MLFSAHINIYYVGRTIAVRRNPGGVFSKALTLPYPLIGKNFRAPTDHADSENFGGFVRDAISLYEHPRRKAFLFPVSCRNLANAPMRKGAGDPDHFTCYHGVGEAPPCIRSNKSLREGFFDIHSVNL